MIIKTNILIFFIAIPYYLLTVLLELSILDLDKAAVSCLFSQEYVFRVDPATSLGLTSDSIMCYRMGDVVRGQASEVPELLPCGYLVGDNNVITVNLKGQSEPTETYCYCSLLNVAFSVLDTFYVL